jgi:hypothetical protein
VTAKVDCWAAAKVAATANTNNNPIFFMLPPAPSRTGLAHPSLSKDKGYIRKVTSDGGWVKVTRVFSRPTPKVFSERFSKLMLHLGLHPCNIAPLLKNNELG